MKEKIEEIRARLEESVARAKTGKELFELKAKYILGKAGEIPALMKELGKADKEDRPSTHKRVERPRERTFRG